MKKIFLLIPALVLALVTNAANVISITPTSPEPADNLRLALNNANDGDEIVMAAGTYVESPENYIAFISKNVIVRAAEGAEVVLVPQVPITISGGSVAEFRNIQIDASELCSVNSYSHLIYPTDAVGGNSLILDGCEIYGYEAGKAVIAARSTNVLESVIINNCKFYNHTTRSCVFLENTDNQELRVTNSTFYNIVTGTADFSAGVIDNRSTTAEVRVDHCTFYNVEVKGTGYAAIGQIKTSDAIVSNCIFAMPTSVDGVRAIRDVAQANNCLTFNYLYDSGRGIHGDVVRNNCIFADPLFDDLANDNYTFKGDWTTMEISPARGAATDGTDLGDPRWYSDEVLPSTSFASGYQFVGAKAQISGNLWYDGTNEYLYYDNKSECGVATWKITATRACIVEATLNMNAATTTGHKFKIEVLDAEGHSIGETAEPSQVETAGDIALPDQITLPAAGNYTVKLFNLTGWSSAKIDGVTLSYTGGAVQSMPGTTDIDDAWFSSNGTRTAGEYISIPSGHQHEGWVKWNVSFASAANYNVTVNIDNANGHNYTVALYEDEDDLSPITLSEGGQKGTIGTIELGAMEVPAGNYIMKVTNATQYSDAKLISVNFAYAGGAAVNLSKDTPASLLANSDAILSDDWTIEGGKITHAESTALTGWAKWNVACADDAIYNVTVNISSDNGHLVRVEVFEDEANPAIYTLDETSDTKYHTGDQAIDLGNINLADRDYVVKVSNTQEYSHVQIASIVITYVSGARATLPATLNANDLLFSTIAYADGGEIYFSPDPGSHNVFGEWAKWNVKVAEAGTFLFTMNVTSTDGQSYKITILDGETEIDAFESGSVGSGDKAIKHYFNLAAGKYTVKLENTYTWSHGHIVSLVVTQPSLLVLDELATTNSVIHDNYRNGTHDIQLSRSFATNMYNTICLPFDVSDAQLKAIFGNDVELLQMASAVLDGDILDLNFSAVTTGIYRGTPYLIQSSKAVANPVFTDVEIKEETGQATSGDDADFIGTFIKTTIDADPDNLYLQANNILNFSNNAVTIKGSRAYFHVNIPGASSIISRARIVKNEEEVSAVELVNSENNSRKVIENGQLIIIRDGVRYNVMGIVIEK